MTKLKVFPPSKLLRSHIIFVIATIIASLILGSSNLFFTPSYGSIIFLAIFCTLFVVYFLLDSPIIALLIAVFVVFIPHSFLTAEIASFLNRTTTILALGIWFFDIVVKKHKFTLNLSALLMVGFLTWSLITLLWAPNESFGIELLQVYLLRTLLFLVLVVNVINSQKKLETFMNVIALNGVLIAVVSLIFISTNGYVPGSRLKVLGINENELGISLMIGLPGIFWWSMREPNYRFLSLRNSLAGIYFLITIALTGLSGSRGSAISLGIMLLIFMAWKSTRLWSLVALLAVVAAVIVAPQIFSTTIERFLGAPGDTALGGREYIWPAGVQLIRDHIFLGVGIGNSSYEVIPYMISNGAPWVSPLGEPLHNPIMAVWADTGFIGIILYLSVLVSAISSFCYEFYKYQKAKNQNLIFYFELVFAIMVGFLVSWIKGGGMEASYEFFLLISLLLIPSILENKTLKKFEG